MSPQSSRRKSARVLRGSDRHAAALAVDRQVDLDAQPWVASSSAAVEGALDEMRADRVGGTSATGVDVGRRVGVGDREPADLGEIERRSTAAPTSACSAACARTGAMPMPSSADRAAARPGRPSTSTPHDGAGEREVAAAAGDLLDREAGARRPHREADRGHEISSGSTAVVHVPRKNSAAGTGRTPLASRDLDLGVQGDGDGRVLRRGIGVRERTADRAAVADLEVADQRRRPASSGHRRGLAAVALDGGAGGPSRRSARAPSTRSMPSRLGDPVEVDEVLEPVEAQRQHRHQALAAGEHGWRLAAVLGEQRDRAVDRVGRRVLERRQLHSGSSRLGE